MKLSTAALISVMASTAIVDASISSKQNVQIVREVRKMQSVSNPTECLEDGFVVDETVDYFPSKVSPKESKFWSIEYFSTYKVLTNLVNNATYLLYLCGTTPPSDTDEAYNATIAVPIKQVSVNYVNTISFLEQLNKGDSIVAYTNDESYIGSPCLLEKISESRVYVVRNSSELESLRSKNFIADMALNPDEVVSFNSPWDTVFPFNKNVITSTENELTNAAIFEWVKFYSTFFNMEDVGNMVFDAAQDRKECIANAAALTTADGEKPVVLWGYYSEYCGGWDLGSCPNYYCEFADVCSATIISVPFGTGSINATELCGQMYMTIDEVIEAGGAEADYWIFPSDNWDTTYEMFKDQLDTFKSVQNLGVFDVQGSGLNAWFERRYAEYYDVIQDFCSSVGTTVGLGRTGWFRNVLDGKSVVGGQNEDCSDPNRTSSILPYTFGVCDIGSGTSDAGNTPVSQTFTNETDSIITNSTTANTTSTTTTPTSTTPTNTTTTNTKSNASVVTASSMMLLALFGIVISVMF